MNVKKVLKRCMGIGLAATVLASLIVCPVYAATEYVSGSATDYVWQPKITNVSDMTFTEVKSDGENNAVTIEKNTDNNTVTLKYNDSEDDVTKRKVKEVRLDTQSIPGYNHYVSFDLKMSGKEEFVATMDLNRSDDMRSHSLYVGTHSNAVTYASALQHDPDKYFVKGGALVTANKGWWYNNGLGGVRWADTSKSINVKLVNKSQYSPKNANKEQIVEVYINDVRYGQVAKSTETNANEFFNFDNLRFIHYVTASGSNSVTLSNIEIGYVYKNEGYAPLKTGNSCIKGDKIEFPEGNKVYAKVTMTANGNTAWEMYAAKGATSGGAPTAKPYGKASWTGKFGLISGSGVTAEQKDVYGYNNATGLLDKYGENGNWNRDSFYWDDGGGTVTIIVTLDRKNKTFTLHREGYPASADQVINVEDITLTDGSLYNWAAQSSGQQLYITEREPLYDATDGHLRAGNVTGSLSKTDWGAVKSVETGVVIDRGLTADAYQESDGVWRIRPTGFGNAAGDSVTVLFVHRDADNSILNAYLKSINKDSDEGKNIIQNGIWYLHKDANIAKNLVNGADHVDVYVWDSDTFAPLSAPAVVESDAWTATE